MDIAELSMLLEVLDVKSVTDEEVRDAESSARSMRSAFSQEQSLLLYGLHKQYSVGDVTIASPSEADVVEKYKWNAWKSFEGFPKMNAALAYVYLVNQFKTGQSNSKGDSSRATSKKEDSDNSTGMDNGLGSGYVSTLNNKTDASSQWSKEEEVFQCVVDSDLSSLSRVLAADASVISTHSSEDGMTPLHYAADRGYSDVARLLVDHGADINAVDNEQQTPLMYAVTCSNRDMVELLVSCGADLSIRNSDGCSVLDLDDIDSGIRELLTSRT